MASKYFHNIIKSQVTESSDFIKSNLYHQTEIEPAPQRPNQPNARRAIKALTYQSPCLIHEISETFSV